MKSTQKRRHIYENLTRIAKLRVQHNFVRLRGLSGDDGGAVRGRIASRVGDLCRSVGYLGDRAGFSFLRSFFLPRVGGFSSHRNVKKQGEAQGRRFTGGAQPTFVLPGIQPPPGPSPENLQKGDII